MICPNLSDPIIKEEFNKLKKAVGEVQAYDIWNKNNGYYLDKLPTGEDSNIFKELVSKYGDENTAIKHIATLYSKDYFEAMMNEIAQSEHPIAALYEDNVNNNLVDLVAQNTGIKNYKELAQLISIIIKENDYTISTEIMPYNNDSVLGRFKLVKKQLTSNTFYYASKMEFIPFTHPKFKKNLEKVEHTILHEYMHALTSLAYATNISFKKEIDDLYNTTIDMLKKIYGEKADVLINSAYGLTSPEEFIAEVFTDKDFQLLLKTIPYDKGEKLTIFQKFVDYIVELLQPYADERNVKIHKESMFDAVIKAVETQVMEDFNMSDIINENTDYSLDNIKNIIKQNKEIQQRNREIMNEITWTDEEGNPCAKMGGRSSKFTKGSQWEIVKDLKGYPSHAQGGVDIKLGKDGFSFARGEGHITAAHGLILPAIKAADGLIMENDDKEVKNKSYKEWKDRDKTKAPTLEDKIEESNDNLPKVKSGEETPQWVKDKQNKKVDKINFWESLNYKKWGLSDYSDYSSFNSAFRNARENKEKEFVYKDNRYNTNLISREQSDLYWESKKFLEDYYKTQNYQPFDTTIPYNAWDLYMKETKGTSWTEYYNEIKDSEDYRLDSEKYYDISNKLTDLDYLDKNGRDKRENNKDYDAFLERLKAEKIESQRAKQLSKLHDKSYYFSITDQKPKDMAEDGYLEEKNRKMFLRATNNGNLNTTYVHELSHKADDWEVERRVPEIDIDLINAVGILPKKYTQKDFEYITEPTELEARKFSTLFYLHKNKKPYTNITKEQLDDLYITKDLPYDIEQLLDVFAEQKEDLLKYLNNDFSYLKKNK